MIGIIGGSGLDNPDILKNSREISLNTEYGFPSSAIKIGKIQNKKVALIARHGREHTIPPTQVNNRANIQALKELGVNYIISTTAVGSLRKDIERGDIVIIDQFIDYTKNRAVSFHESFQPHAPAHTPMAEPFSSELRQRIIDACEELNLRHHKTGTVITIEGPRFSTKAESRMFRVWGADIINMSVAPEAILANEAGIPYAAIAMSTDYDCLFDDMPSVTWEEIIKVFNENSEKVINLLVNVIPKISEFDTQYIKSKIRTIPDWPKPGIMFRDITTLLSDSEAFNTVIEILADRYQNKNIDKIIGIESRGFIIGGALAHRLNLPFIPIRKKGKLPGETVQEEYTLEYGKDAIEIHKDAVKENDNCILVDDLIATGGTVLAATKLVKKLNGIVFECAFIIDLPDLGGTRALTENEIPHYCMIEFEGE